MSAKFKLHSAYQPAGDQPTAIAKLSQGTTAGVKHQVLLGVTGSGKTFTMANVIAHANRPTLIISHNKTLAAQLYSEFKGFFPDNAVEYFVSYFDYYQPEAYIPRTDTFIEKDSAVNDEIERLRLSTMNSLLGRRDVIVIASVSCIYGIGSKEDYEAMVIPLRVGQSITRLQLLERLVALQYQRNDFDLTRSKFRVRGDVIELHPAYTEDALRIEFFGDEIERMSRFDPLTGDVAETLVAANVFPSKQFATPEKGVCHNEKLDLVDRLTGDASTRRYYRLFTDKSSYVVCLDNPQADPNTPHPFASKQSFFEQAGVRVPGILDMNLARGYLLEEDLGDVTFLTHLATIRDEAEELKLYQQVVQQLLSLHRLPRAQVEKSGLFGLAFDHKKYMEEMDFTFKFFFGHFLKFTDAEVIGKIRHQVDQICTRLAAQPMVLTHRDFHSRNIMVKGGELIFIDFQDARWGIPQYDLVSLLEDCYYELSQANRESLKRKYYEELPATAHGQGDWRAFCDFYDDMLFQRVFKAIGSFSYIYATRQDARYLKYIGFGMEKIRRTLMSSERYTELRKLLLSVYYAS